MRISQQSDNRVPTCIDQSSGQGQSKNKKKSRDSISWIPVKLREMPSKKLKQREQVIIIYLIWFSQNENKKNHHF
jgi:hypothetical protein